MRKESAEKELKKIRARKQECIEREKELEHVIREKNKEECMKILETFHISPEDLLELLKEHEVENKRILKEREKSDVEM